LTKISLLTKNALVRTSEFPLLSNVLKRVQFSCQCFTVYLRSTTIVTWLTEHDDVTKSLLRGAPRLGFTLGPQLLGPALPVISHRLHFVPATACSRCRIASWQINMLSAADALVVTDVTAPIEKVPRVEGFVSVYNFTYLTSKRRY